VRPSVLLWDFGDTLVDERWMRRPPEDCRDWPTAWSTVMAARADSWNNGDITALTVYQDLSELTGLTLEAVESHARDCCQRLIFHETAWRVAIERRLPQAIVTVNPDIFGDLIVPHYGLSDIFDEIVMSWVEQTDDKPVLCDVALSRLQWTGGREAALLIDNRQDLVEAWKQFGGSGYWFQSDAQFAKDLSALLG